MVQRYVIFLIYRINITIYFKICQQLSCHCIFVIPWQLSINRKIMVKYKTVNPKDLFGHLKPEVVTKEFITTENYLIAMANAK